MIAALRKALSLSAPAPSSSLSATEISSQAGAWGKLERESWSEAVALHIRLTSEVAAAEEKLLLLLRWGSLDALHPFLKMSHLKIQHFAIRNHLYRHVHAVCQQHQVRCHRRLAGDESVSVSTSPVLEQLSRDDTTHRIRVRLKHCNAALESLSSSVSRDMAALSAAAADEPVQLAAQLASESGLPQVVCVLVDSAASPTAEEAMWTLTPREHSAMLRACSYLALATEAVAAKEAQDRSQLSDSLYIRSAETCHLQPIESAAWFQIGSCSPDGPVTLQPASPPVHTQHQAQQDAANLLLSSTEGQQWQHSIVLSGSALTALRRSALQRSQLRARLSAVFMDRRCQWGKLVAAWCRRVIGYDPISAAWWARLQAVLRIDTARTGVELPPAYQVPAARAAGSPHDSPATRPRAGSSASALDPAASNTTDTNTFSLPLPRVRTRQHKTSSHAKSLREVHQQAAAWGMFHTSIGRMLGCELQDVPSTNSLPRPKLVNAFAKWLSNEIARETAQTIEGLAAAAPGQPAAKVWAQQHLLPAVQWEIFSRLHALLFASGQVQWMPEASGGYARIRAADRRWRRKAPLVAGCTPAQLGIQASILSDAAGADSSLFALPRSLLAVSETLMSPDDMLQCMCCAVDCMLLELRLRNGGRETQVAADDLAPLLMCLMARSCMSQPHAALAFVGTYGLGGTAAQATGERGYILISLQLALTAVLQHRSEDSVCSPSADALALAGVGEAGAAEEGTTAVAAAAAGSASEAGSAHGAAADIMDADEALVRLGSGRISPSVLPPAAQASAAESAAAATASDAAEESVWEALGAEVRGGETAHADKEGIQAMGEWIGDHKVIQETLVLFS